MEKKGAEKAQAWEMEITRNDSSRFGGFHLIFSKIARAGASANPLLWMQRIRGGLDKTFSRRNRFCYIEACLPFIYLLHPPPHIEKN